MTETPLEAACNVLVARAKKWCDACYLKRKVPHTCYGDIAAARELAEAVVEAIPPRYFSVAEALAEPRHDAAVSYMRAVILRLLPEEATND